MLNSKTPSRLSSVELAAIPLILSEFHGEVESTYQVFKLKMSVDGQELTSPEASTLCLDGVEMWLSQRYNRAAEILTCSCGVLECAGFQEQCSTIRKKQVLSWTFPEGYFHFFKARGLATGRSRALTFHFDAVSFNEQIEQVFGAVRAYEAESGKPSGFEAGSYTAPRYGIDTQLQYAHAHHLRTSKSQRFRRFQGTPSGVCAGS